MDKKIMCHLMNGTPSESELVPTSEHFTCLNTFVDESHLFRYLLQCKKCRQLYFFEFYEEIDWEAGDDPQYCTYIPINTAEEADELNKKNQLELLGVLPRLQHDSGKGNTGEVRWMR